ncbi:S24 family peptidase [Kaistia nematophila]|uniref:S24 family peptidase n=1 Tax=Kaistia nematophila TaxID=2994654 RepID=A0A9X3E3S2_9HYPH|nr:S24 family peptidase [Kaistia nematophila]MCX5570593.1 S24 family peptidase [Kaistia nematophila]
MSAIRADQLRTLLLNEMEGRTDPTRLARDIGRGKDYIRDFLGGKKESIGAAELLAIEEVLGLPAGRLTGRATAEPSAATALAPTIIPGHELVGAKDLPVYAAAMGGHGHEIVTFDPIDWVKRPVILERVKGAYGILVVNTSMSPLYRPNDIALINPHLAPTPDTEVVLYHMPPNGESEAMIKTLVSSAAKEWRLRQYNPAQDFSVDRVDWPVCHRVVGKYDRR